MVMYCLFTDSLWNECQLELTLLFSYLFYDTVCRGYTFGSMIDELAGFGRK
jgi:hypothetical protein